MCCCGNAHIQRTNNNNNNIYMGVIAVTFRKILVLLRVIDRLKKKMVALYAKSFLKKLDRMKGIFVRLYFIA